MDPNLFGLVCAAGEGPNPEEMSVKLFVNFLTVVGDCPVVRGVVGGVGKSDDKVVIPLGIIPDALAERFVCRTLLWDPAWMTMYITAESVRDVLINLCEILEILIERLFERD
ncbi:hypothetical protein Z052_08780 [Halorubrum sp. C191]|uniref:hypothetical protein n=1 Tax=Halorubrum sp. C191 TaxID=1383842 RepID=UPI000C0856AE|nr:hypothetical protein [Halorubrum sp. C191]PHQ42562.1 hypothetical protein Z052_08780 [Halorubrum sp. C191]